MPGGKSAAVEPFGTLPDGRGVERYTLANARGVEVSVLTLGAIVQRVLVPDRDGRFANVTLGFADLDGYLRGRAACFGALVGRYANRIAGGRFTLDGHEYALPRNDGPNCLHGGDDGFATRVWEAEPVAPGAVRLTLRSPDGDCGFPGALAVAAVYTLGDDDTLRLDVSATTDRPTVVNLASHAYWNLAGEGEGTIDAHELRIAAARYTPVDAARIPTGALAPVAGTPLDFRTPTAVGARVGAAGGYDHNWVLDGAAGELSAAAVLRDPGSGRVLTLSTTAPGLQVYSGNALDGTSAGASGRRYGRRAGIALEPQHFPDSPNRPGFPSTVLRPGATYTSSTVFAFSADARA